MLRTLGVLTLTAASTPQQLTTDLSILAKSFTIQALPFNAGRVVVGADASIEPGNLASVQPSGRLFGIVGVPNNGDETPPFFAANRSAQGLAFQLANVWWDGTNTGDKIICVYDDGA